MGIVRNNHHGLGVSHPINKATSRDKIFDIYKGILTYSLNHPFFVAMKISASLSAEAFVIPLVEDLAVSVSDISSMFISLI